LVAAARDDEWPTVRHALESRWSRTDAERQNPEHLCTRIEQNERLEEAQAALGSAQPQVALGLLRRLEPDVDVLVARARAREALGQLNRALECYQRALELESSPTLLAATGLLSLRVGDMQNTRRLLEEAVRSGITDPEV